MSGLPTKFTSHVPTWTQSTDIFSEREECLIARREQDIYFLLSCFIIKPDRNQPPLFVVETNALNRNKHGFLLPVVRAPYVLHVCWLPSACLTGCSVFSSGWFQMRPAALWQKEWSKALNLSCAVLPSFSIALQEYILQRSSLVLMVCQNKVFLSL